MANTINHTGELYIDSNGELRQVMEDIKKGFVRGVNISAMTITGYYITEELESLFSGHGFNSKRHKVKWVE